MTDKTGGPAFPTSDWDENDKAYKMHGMTLRDYFAAKALPAIYKDYCEDARLSGWDDNWRYVVAEDAYEMAANMLKAREQ